MSILGNGLLPQFGGEGDGGGGDTVSPATNFRIAVTDRDGEFVDAVATWDLPGESRTGLLLNLPSGNISLDPDATSAVIAQGHTEYFFEVGESYVVKVVTVNGSAEADSEIISFSTNFCTSLNASQAAFEVSATWSRPTDSVSLKLQWSDDSGATWHDASATESSWLEADTLASGYWTFAAGILHLRVVDFDVNIAVTRISESCEIEIIAQSPAPENLVIVQQAGNLQISFDVPADHNWTTLEARYQSYDGENWTGWTSWASFNGYIPSGSGGAVGPLTLPGPDPYNGALDYGESGRLFEAEVRGYAYQWADSPGTISDEFQTFSVPNGISYSPNSGTICAEMYGAFGIAGPASGETGAIVFRFNTTAILPSDGDVSVATELNGIGEYGANPTIPTPPFIGDGDYYFWSKYISDDGLHETVWSNSFLLPFYRLIWTPAFDYSGGYISWDLPLDGGSYPWNSDSSFSWVLWDVTNNTWAGADDIAWDNTTIDLASYVSSGVDYEFRLTASNACSTKMEIYQFTA